MQIHKGWVLYEESEINSSPIECARVDCRRSLVDDYDEGVGIFRVRGRGGQIYSAIVCMDCYRKLKR